MIEGRWFRYDRATCSAERTCRGCRAPIVFIDLGPARRPLDVRSARREGEHVLMRDHFETCPKAARFRGTATRRRGERRTQGAQRSLF